MISKKYLSECFDYDELTGDLSFKHRPRHHFKSDQAYIVANAKTKGRKVRSIHPNGSGNKYYKVKILGKSYLAHRLVWVLIHDIEPEAIDHINGNGLDNRILNLRSVTHTENCRNARKHKTNSSGVMGVYKNKRDNTWYSMIWNNNKQINIGTYKTKCEAVAARKGAEKALGYHKNHGNNRTK